MASPGPQPKFGARLRDLDTVVEQPIEDQPAGRLDSDSLGKALQGPLRIGGTSVRLHTALPHLESCQVRYRVSRSGEALACRGWL